MAAGTGCRAQLTWPSGVNDHSATVVGTASNANATPVAWLRAPSAPIADRQDQRPHLRCAELPEDLALDEAGPPRPRHAAGACRGRHDRCCTAARGTAVRGHQGTRAHKHEFPGFSKTTGLHLRRRSSLCLPWRLTCWQRGE